MKELKTRSSAAAISITALILSQNVSHAVTITNGNLSVDILAGNGAIGSASLGGVEYFRVGTFVSDWGLQTFANTSTFAINNAYGAAGIPVTIATVGGAVSASGIYSNGKDMVGISRTYSLVGGVNVLRIDSSLYNIVSPGVPSLVTLRYFDTFDPDQDGFTNFMDRYNIGSNEVASASNFSGATVIFGNPTGFTALASGGPFQINNGTTLNNFFSAPFDANGGFVDSGMHGGMEFTLDGTEPFNTTYYLAFGTTPALAETDFNTAIVPEPTAAVLTGIGALSVLRRRRVKG